MKYLEIETIKELKKLLKNNKIINKKAFQNLDFRKVKEIAIDKFYDDCIFLGCKLPKSLSKKLTKNNLIFPMIETAFNPFINHLYNKDILFDKYQLEKPETQDKCLDTIIYNHYLENGKISYDIKETLARRLHDHSITDALYDFLSEYDEKKVIAIMGGHNLPRNNTNFFEIAKISKMLTEDGYLMVSGGGPGAMEATHVGAWMAGKSEGELKKAIDILSEAPVYNDTYWLDKSYKVFQLFPTSEYKSLGIPTWLYGHEPPTPFATHIAKYFANSVREDGLLTIAKGGIIFSPGNAGTIQEIFQEATQNHYLSFGYASPMIFFNSMYWTYDKPIFPLLKNMLANGKYKNLILSKCDTPKEVIAEIYQFSQQKSAVNNS